MDETPPRDRDSSEPPSPVDEVPPPPPLEATLPHMEARPAQRTAAHYGGRFEEWLDLLNNRLVLGALGLVAVLLLTAIVFLSIGRGDAGPNRSVSAIATSGGTPRTLGGLSGRLLATVSVRNGPNSPDILGTIPKGTVITVVGRSEDSTWLQIRYPPNSTLRGWVDAQFLDVTGNVSLLEVGSPGPSPSIEAPTAEPTHVQPVYTATPSEPAPTASESPTPEHSATPTAQRATPTEPPTTPTSPPPTPTP
jgi:uncharacterized protein YraI